MRTHKKMGEIGIAKTELACAVCVHVWVAYLHRFCRRIPYSCIMVRNKCVSIIRSYARPNSGQTAPNFRLPVRVHSMYNYVRAKAHFDSRWRFISVFSILQFAALYFFSIRNGIELRKVCQTRWVCECKGKAMGGRPKCPTRSKARRSTTIAPAPKSPRTERKVTPEIP